MCNIFHPGIFLLSGEEMPENPVRQQNILTQFPSDFILKTQEAFCKQETYGQPV